ncbi:MAG: MFS transporter [Candidatus Micrarchaeota archaeon]
MKRVVSIALLDAAVVSIQTVVLPLYFVAIAIGAAEMGVIFAVMQVVFLFARIAFAVAGDQIGPRKILAAGGIFTFIMNIIYAIASSPVFFALGQVFDGLRASAFWAVIRTAAFRASKPGEESRNSAIMVSARSLATSLAKVAAGLLLVYLSFQNIFFLLAGVGLLMALLAISMKNGDSPGKISLAGAQQLLRTKRGWSFWRTSLPLVSCDIPYTALFSFVVPVYMKVQLNMSYEAIGFWLAVFFFLEAAANYAATKLKLDYKLTLYLVLLTAVVPIALLALPQFFVPALVLFGIGSGLSAIAYEHTVAKATKNKRDTSTAIALLMIPTRIGDFLSLIGAGLIIAVAGFTPVFILCALFWLGFVLLSLRLVASSRRKPV